MIHPAPAPVHSGHARARPRSLTVDIEDIIELEIERRLGRVRREIEAWLAGQGADPGDSELLTFEIDENRKLLILVPVDVAEDVQATPLAELRARYPSKEIAIP